MEEMDILSAANSLSYVRGRLTILALTNASLTGASISIYSRPKGESSLNSVHLFSTFSLYYKKKRIRN